MGRKFDSKATVEDLKTALVVYAEKEGLDPEAMCAAEYLVSGHKDVKVEVDTENFGIDYSEIRPILGFFVLDNGFVGYGVYAGGNWEHPVYAVLYLYKSKIRAYVPTEGNPWNTDTNQAYGNDDAADLKNARKRYPEQFKDTPDDYEIDVGDFSFELEKITKDIVDRIHPDVLPDPKEDLHERLKELKLYGTGCEGEELFGLLVQTSYKLRGLGSEKEAEIAYKWAEEHATASKHDVYEGHTDENDFVMGSEFV